MVKKAAVLALLMLIGGPALVDARGAAPGTVELTMSNFRYCAGQTCTPLDQGYVRSSDGPVSGADNPKGIIDVPEGSTVTWVYRDAGPGSCDFFEQCPGHNVRFEDGTAKGVSMGAARSRRGATTITTSITQKAGTLIRYFCSVNDHYRTGMTGILRVVAAPGG